MTTLCADCKRSYERRPGRWCPECDSPNLMYREKRGSYVFYRDRPKTQKGEHGK